MRIYLKRNLHKDDSQRINNYDGILDIIYFKAKNTTKLEFVITGFDAGLLEK